MAERALNLTIADINTAVKAVSFGSSITTRGLCYLQTKDKKTFPLENTGSRNGNIISWDDKYPLQVYHRIIDVEKESDNSKGFGANAHRQRVYSMRLVGIGSKDKITSTSYEDNQDIANTISDAMPSFISSTEYVEVTDHEVIKSVVYDSEFAGVNKNKELSLEGIAFWIDYTLTVLICDTTP